VPRELVMVSSAHRPHRERLIWGKGYGEMEVPASIQRSSLSLQKVLAATKAGSRRPDIGTRRKVGVLRDREWGKRYRKGAETRCERQTVARC